ncbi:MAG: class I SAM-dependent methyltransferase [Candidatus Omnitrophica bacterium]|nr:class I SAM-dependent methyltransferase [Candidatus Omnitrophota bacterium]
MSTKTIQMEDALHAYYLNATLRETEVQKRLRDETAKLSHGHMQISPEQGQFMALLIELMGAKKTLEIGTFTGYSALCVARALPEDGRLIACDVNEEWTSIGKRYWEEAGLADRIDLRIGPAAKTLDRMIENGETGDFDFAFIDADKLGYDGYYEQCLILLRAGGLIAIDNTLWNGKIADPAIVDEETVAIRELLEKVRDDQRVTSSLVPIGDGLLLARKR